MNAISKKLDALAFILGNTVLIIVVEVLLMYTVVYLYCVGYDFKQNLSATVHVCIGNWLFLFC